MAVEESPHRAGREAGAVLAPQQLAQFDQRDIRLRLDRGQDHVAIGLDVMRAQVAALRQRRHPPLDPPGTHPAHSAGHRNAEASCRGVAGQAAIDRGDHP
jgi:hypothetical protein